MSTDIRKYIKNNLKDCDEKEIEETVIASVSSNDEVVLPGLGVLFEIIWNNSDNEYRNKLINTIKLNLKKS